MIVAILLSNVVVVGCSATLAVVLVGTVARGQPQYVLLQARIEDINPTAEVVWRATLLFAVILF